MTDTPQSDDLRRNIRSTIQSMIRTRGSDKTLCPSEVARSIAGQDEKVWRKLMKPIRSEAVDMAKAGSIAIKRKGKTVDPTDFKGVYRLGTAEKPGNDG